MTRLLSRSAFLLPLLAVLLGTVRPASAAPLELAKDGRSAYVISLPGGADETLRLAATELQSYLVRMTGARLPIRRGGQIPDKAILLATESLDNGPKLDGEAFAVAQRGEHLLMYGARDRAVLFAVYDFLEHFGCRFVAPEFRFYGGAAEVVPSLPTLTVNLPRDVIRRPQLRFRKLYVEEGHSHNLENLQQMVQWMPKLRFNTLVVPVNYQGQGRVKWDTWRDRLTPELRRRDLIIEVGGHGYQNFLNASMEGGRLYEQHPEWFGADAQGNRLKDMNRVFCTSNKEAVHYVIEGLVLYLHEHPEVQIFDFWPPDGARWCECEECKKLGSPSNRQAILLNEAQVEVAKVANDVRLETIAYASYLSPPEKERLIPMVLIDFCPIAQSFEAQIFDTTSAANTRYATNLGAWRKAFDGDVSLYSYYRKYAWHSLPVLIPHYMQADLKWYAKVPVQGISSYAEPGDWATYELNHYVLGHLAWRPTANVDGLIAGYCAARYGPLADSAKELLGVLERTTRTYGSLPGTALKTLDAIAKARGEVEGSVERFHAAAMKVDDRRYTSAAERLLLMAEYARRDLQLQESRAARANPAERQKAVEELAQFLRVNGSRGVFTVYDRLEAPALARSYGLRNRNR